MTTVTTCCEEPRMDAARWASEGCRELANTLAEQGRGYGLLAHLFAREVTDELLAELRTAKYPAVTGNDRLDRGYRELCRYLNGSWERTRGELAVDYFHTFIGNTQDVEQVAFPYESVYTSPDHLLMQDARDEVLAAYRSLNVMVSEDANPTNDPEDHVAFELAFLGLLGNRAADALRSGDEDGAAELLEAKRGFLRGHLLNWVPAFADDMARIAQTGFYRALADLLVGTLQTDAVLLDELLGEPASGAGCDPSRR